jgi:TRAP-type mannitol/chloroaromatic compound transport system permease small subunit
MDKEKFGINLCINILLTLFFFIPGIIHAIFYVKNEYNNFKFYSQIDEEI